VFPQKRRINGDAPQFDSFSDQFDPFAIPQEITEPETPPVRSVDVQRPKTSDPLNDDFNPFEEPEETVDSQTQSVESAQQSTADPFSDNFDPFSDLDSAKDSDDSRGNTQTQPADTTQTQTQKNSVAQPTEQEADPFEEPKQLQPENLAPVPPVSEANEQTGKGTSSGNGLENPFPDLSEKEADRNHSDENPFTGLKLGGESENGEGRRKRRRGRRGGRRRGRSRETATAETDSASQGNGEDETAAAAGDAGADDHASADKAEAPSETTNGTETAPVDLEVSENGDGIAVQPADESGEAAPERQGERQGESESEPESASEPEPVPEPVEDSKPKRGGWWQKRSFL